MPEIRVTQDGNTYQLRWGKLMHGGEWIRGRAQNLTPWQFAQFVTKLMAKFLAALAKR